MKKQQQSLHKFESLTEFHQLFGLSQPRHPLISFIDLLDLNFDPAALPDALVMEYYKIAYKKETCGRAKYGQQYYDFGQGGLIFTAPGQVFEKPTRMDVSGYMLLVHPDLLRSYPLSTKIKQYGFFSYAANEALHLSEEELTTITTVFKIIDEELNSRIDDFSQDVIVSQVELLLNYSNRYYKRQFITRKAVANDQLQRIDEILDQHFDGGKAVLVGIPTVQSIAEQLNLSPGYLSDMLRALTGQNAQQLIHQKLVEKAKEILSTSNLSVSEVAYQLGFEHPQSFSRMFKAKTKLSPLDFRHSFN